MKVGCKFFKTAILIVLCAFVLISAFPCVNVICRPIGSNWNNTLVFYDEYIGQTYTNAFMLMLGAAVIQAVLLYEEKRNAYVWSALIAVGCLEVSIFNNDLCEVLDDITRLTGGRISRELETTVFGYAAMVLAGVLVCLQGLRLICYLRAKPAK